MVDLSIIILNYKTAGLVKQCIKGIYKYPPKVEYEIIVVDNNSGDGCTDWMRNNMPDVKISDLPTNRGYSAGNNAGLRRARGKFVLIMNPDVLVLENSLDTLYQYMLDNPKVGLAGPKLLNPDGSLQYSTYKFPKWWLPIIRRTFLGKMNAFKDLTREYQMMDWDHQNNQTVDWLLGGCLIARARAIEDVGILDERFFLYVEDTDWCRRFWQKDWEVAYVADSQFVHFHERLSAQASLGVLFKKITWVHIHSWFKYFWKWRGQNNIRN